MRLSCGSANFSVRTYIRTATHKLWKFIVRNLWLWIFNTMHKCDVLLRIYFWFSKRRRIETKNGFLLFNGIKPNNLGIVFIADLWVLDSSFVFLFKKSESYWMSIIEYIEHVWLILITFWNCMDRNTFKCF